MPSKSLSNAAPSDEAVRTRAYLMWEADGRPDGRAEHYWGLAAEAFAGDSPKPKRAAAAKADVPVRKAKPRAAAKPEKSAPVAKGKKKG